MNEEELKNELEELFYKKLNIENNLTKWVEKIKYQTKQFLIDYIQEQFQLDFI